MSQVPKRDRIQSPLALTLAITTLTTSILTAACQQQQTTSQSNGTPTTAPSPATTPTTTSTDGLKLGTLLPTTGDLSSIGQNLPEAVKLAVDTVNACGGVNEKQVTVANQDDETDPAKGSTAMTQLVDVDKVAGVVGSFASSVSSAAVDIAVRNKVMLVSPGSTSPVFTERAKKGEFQGYWARTAPPDTYQAQALAALANKRGFKTASTVVINNDYGVGFEQEFVKAFEKLGGKLTDKDKPVRYDPKAATLDSEAAAAFGDKPDAVAAVLYT
ncbi:MAG: ABC transporter substrate-binding protein, partial [Microcystaceae cyanobacterium]